MTSKVHIYNRSKVGTKTLRQQEIDRVFNWLNKTIIKTDFDENLRKHTMFRY